MDGHRAKKIKPIKVQPTNSTPVIPVKSVTPTSGCDVLRCLTGYVCTENKEGQASCATNPIVGCENLLCLQDHTSVEDGVGNGKCEECPTTEGCDTMICGRRFACIKYEPGQGICEPLGCRNTNCQKGFKCVVDEVGLGEYRVIGCNDIDCEGVGFTCLGDKKGRGRCKQTCKSLTCAEGHDCFFHKRRGTFRVEGCGVKDCNESSVCKENRFGKGGCVKVKK